MKIIRDENCPACFFTENRKHKYLFEISGQEAILHTKTDKYLQQAIDEFIFYSGFIVLIKDAKDGILLEREVATQLHKIAKIQPSQFYISEQKLKDCKKWIKSPQDIFVPITISEDGKTIALDGHTRIRAALDLGYDSIFVYEEETGKYIFDFADETMRRGINCVADMEIISAEEYQEKWHKFCDDFFDALGNLENANGG
ncbi:MAG: hypothetical protein FWD01_00570 [Defluviitaleaceae bacterium]|nr:hypothetical protein [Defluviitaleaceae bacterium]